MKSESVYKMPACNWRFGVSGGVARPKFSANLQVSCPARALVSRHPRQAAPTLAASVGSAVQLGSEENENI